MARVFPVTVSFVVEDEGGERVGSKPPRRDDNSLEISFRISDRSWLVN